MRDAVDATGRDIEKLNTSTECSRAAELGWLSTLKNRLRRGILHKPSVCTFAAMGGHLEIVKWARKKLPVGGGTLYWRRSWSGTFRTRASNQLPRKN